MMRKIPYILFVLSIAFSPSQSLAQCDTATIYANTTSNAVCFDTTFSIVRNCYSNNYPDHTDSYSSPFTLTASEEEYSMCLYPDTATYFTPLYETVETSVGCTDIYTFGVGTNGVKYDPSSGEYFEDTGTGENNIDWHVEARYIFSGNFGNNGGHLNPFGEYHYHDVPADYFATDLGITIAEHSPIVGWAADGFPMYYKFVYTDPNDTSSAITELSSGYTLKSGTRPGDGVSAPDGSYTGLYYEDYEYTTATLDSCNGRWGKTPDFPDGTYYYVLTDTYPYIPRCFKGTAVDHTFRVGPSASCPSSTASSDCSAAPTIVSGCMDPFSCNYNASATVDDGSCDYNYTYDTLTITSNGTYTAPSGTFYNDDGTYLDTLTVVGDCDTAYSINLTVLGAVSNRNLTHPSSSGAADGEILFGMPTGTAPFEFSIDSGATYSTALPPRFSNLSVGSYWTVIKDGNGNEIFEEVSLSAVLPIDLLSFEGEAHQGKIILNWSTLSEINSDYFEIERSINGVNFKALEKMPSHHHSQQLESYVFYDIDLSEERYYYRLKMVDYDGFVDYSEIIAIDVRSSSIGEEIILFPNPTSASLIIENGMGRAVFYNQLGQVVEDLKIPSHSFQVNTLDWPQGKYFIQFYNNQGVKKVASFIKIKAW